MSLALTLTKEEENILSSYAKSKGLSISEAIKKTMFEMIEDEEDRRAGEKGYKEYLKSGKKSRPISKLWEELEI